MIIEVDLEVEEVAKTTTEIEIETIEITGIVTLSETKATIAIAMEETATETVMT